MISFVIMMFFGSVSTGIIGSDLFFCTNSISLPFGPLDTLRLNIFTQFYRTFMIKQIYIYYLRILFIKFFMRHQILLL